MARTALTVQETSRGGVVPSAVVIPTDGVQFANTGKEFILLNNTDVGAVNVTFQTPQTVDSLAVAERVVAMGAGEERMLGPFPPTTYNQLGQLFIDAANCG